MCQEALVSTSHPRQWRVCSKRATVPGVWGDEWQQTHPRLSPPTFSSTPQSVILFDCPPCHHFVLKKLRGFNFGFWDPKVTSAQAGRRQSAPEPEIPMRRSHTRGCICPLAWSLCLLGWQSHSHGRKLQDYIPVYFFLHVSHISFVFCWWINTCRFSHLFPFQGNGNRTKIISFFTDRWIFSKVSW